MTENENEYIKQWLFRAGEDIAVIHALSIQNTELYASTICLIDSKLLKNI